VDVTDSKLFSKVGKSILDSLSDTLDKCSLEVPPCSFLGFERPPEINCPDLVAWISNIRPWDGNSVDSGLTDNRLKCFNLWAFDVTIRLGLCYIDFDEDGSNRPPDEQEDLSSIIYQYAHTMYIGWVAQWRSGLVTELTACDPITISSLTSFKEGGCGGWEFTISVGLI
jgi:hypothetical protein